MKKQVNDWLLLAGKDIKVASLIIEQQELTSSVAFHCQQAIEKYFKAFLLNNDKSLLKVHDLLKLYGIIKEIKDLEIDEYILSIINETYIESRYPGELGLLSDGMPSAKQVKMFLEFAKEIEEKIKNAINN